VTSGRPAQWEAGDNEEDQAGNKDKNRPENREENWAEDRDGNRADDRREDQDGNSSVQSARNEVDGSGTAAYGE
jgi:hypothetical protein